MQDTSPPSVTVEQTIQLALSKDRLVSYINQPYYPGSSALELYLWNCEIAEAFSIPLHFVEIVTRNAIVKTLRVRVPNPWYSNKTFCNILGPKQADQLRHIISIKTEAGRLLSSDNDVISDLSFGFWEHLTIKRFHRLLWKIGIKHAFPFAYNSNLTINDIHDSLQKVVQWRNRIAHLK